MMNYKELERDAEIGYARAARLLEEREQLLERLPIRDGLGNPLTWCPSAIPQRLLQSIDKMYESISITDFDTDISIDQESFHSCRIEGAETTQEELFEVFRANRTGVKGDKMIQNTYRAVKYLNVRHKRDEETLITLWRILTDGVLDEPVSPGEAYRTGNVAVWSHKVPEAELLGYCMKQFFEFYYGDNMDCVKSPYIKMAVLHFYFVYMHPFCDGNGRIARLISSDFLIRSGLENFSALTLSKTVNNTKENYYQALDLCDNQFYDVTPFIQYILKAVYDNIYEVLDNQHKNVVEYIDWEKVFE
ncbi:MAG: Fic family protein [Eubacterium sp.]|nr:Fic family protein [Eubacterium sp.]